MLTKNQTTQAQLEGVPALPQALTEEAIHKAADELLAAGKNPTQAAVRNHLGGGSFTTIGEAMKTWHDARKEQAVRASIVRLPDELESKLDGVRQILESAWTLALQQADDRLAKEREALELVRVETEGKVHELQEAVEQLEVELEDTHQVVIAKEEDLRDAKSSHGQELQELRDQLQEQQELLRVAQGDITTERHQRELASQKAVDAAAHSEHLVDQLNRQQQQAERLQAQIDGQTVKIEQQHEQVQQLTHELQVSKHSGELVSQQQTQTQQLLDAALLELQGLREKQAEKDEALQVARGSAELSEQLREQAQLQLQELRVESKEQDKELRGALQELSALKARLAAIGESEGR